MQFSCNSVAILLEISAVQQNDPKKQLNLLSIGNVHAFFKNIPKNWPIWAEIVGGDSTLYLRKDLLKHSTSFGNDLVLCLNEKYIWSQLLRILGIICGNLDKVCDSNKPKNG